MKNSCTKEASKIINLRLFSLLVVQGFSVDLDTRWSSDDVVSPSGVCCSTIINGTVIIIIIKYHIYWIISFPIHTYKLIQSRKVGARYWSLLKRNNILSYIIHVYAPLLTNASFCALCPHSFNEDNEWILLVKHIEHSNPILEISCCTKRLIDVKGCKRNSFIKYSWLNKCRNVFIWIDSNQFRYKD